MLAVTISRCYTLFPIYFRVGLGRLIVFYVLRFENFSIVLTFRSPEDQDARRRALGTVRMGARIQNAPTTYSLFKFIYLFLGFN